MFFSLYIYIIRYLFCPHSIHSFLCNVCYTVTGEAMAAMLVALAPRLAASFSLICQWSPVYVDQP